MEAHRADSLVVDSDKRYLPGQLAVEYRVEDFYRPGRSGYRLGCVQYTEQQCRLLRSFAGAPRAQDALYKGHC